MRILQCHNFYQQAGGEDRVLAEEKALLEAYGHDVEQYLVHNNAIPNLTKLQLFGKTLWSREAHRGVREAVERFRPDVVHVHNTLPLLSPSVYYAARSAGAAVVQTLHNYRMICPGAYCQRDGEVCELCVKKSVKWPAIQHKCYRENRAATATVVAKLAVHGAIGTYRKAVDRFIVCSDFARAKMAEAGFGAGKVVTKPNFQLSDMGVGPGGGGYAMYLGRLSPEKGVGTLLDAWDRDGMDVPLHLVGGGPMEDRVREVASRRPAISVFGHASWDEVIDQMQHASLLVFPSVTYEGHPMTMLEAMQAGTPVVGSRLGAIPELIVEGVTGWTVPSHHPDALAACVAEVMADPARLGAMRRGVRRVYDERYAADASHDRLIAIYEEAIAKRHGKPTETVHGRRSERRAQPTSATQRTSDETANPVMSPAPAVQPVQPILVGDDSR